MATKAKGGLGRGLGALIPQGGPPISVANDPPIAEGVADDLGTPRLVVAAESSEAGGAIGSVASVGSVDEEGLAPVPGARFAEIRVDAIIPNDRQPRQVFDEEPMEELKISIREVGFLQPIVVREAELGIFEIVMGERRWRAAQALGLEFIPAIIRDTRDDEMLRDALMENIHRANLNPLEEAAAYEQLLREFDVNQEELARRIGRSRPQISNTIRLLKLPTGIQRRVAAGVLSAGHARALLTLEDAEQQESMAARIVQEGMSVRATEEAVALAVADGAPVKRKAPARPQTPAALTEVAKRLSDHFDTRVQVDLTRKKGRILIEFGGPEDLTRIIDMIGLTG